MSFTKVSSGRFKGLNSTVAPELIDDGEARDILNFRMEKVGKLVSRNGYQYGLFTRPCFFDGAFPVNSPCSIGDVPNFENITHNEKMTEHEKRTMSYVYSAGCVGINEMVLEDRWEELDTDRLMVYVLRGTEIKKDETGDAGETLGDEYVHRAIYLFAPITGRFQNHIISGTSDDAGDAWNTWLTGQLEANYDMIVNTDWYRSLDTTTISVSDHSDNEAQGMDFTGNKRLRAPNRDMFEFEKNYCHDTLRFPDKINDRWIDHYVDMCRYRHNLIIADRINGDMILENEYSRETLQQGTNRKHKLRLRKDSLDLFNIDDVLVDPRFQDTQENDKAKGVKNGMALYKFVLPKKQAKITDDNFQKVIADEDRVGEGTEDDALAFYQHLKLVLSRQRNTTLLTFLWQQNPFIADPPQAAQPRLGWKNLTLAKRDYEYIFSTYNAAKEIDDLFGELKLDEEEYIKEDGTTEKIQSSDAYIWNDLELQYYPCHGTTYVNDEMFYLNALSRLFDKTIPTMPKIVELNEKKTYARQAPLGVWRYRFVWDYGDGNYSAPSAELLIPDILWSATQDSELTSNYQRPRVLNQSNIGNRAIEDTVYNSFPDSAYPQTIDSYPAIFTVNSRALTAYGQNFAKIKEALYKDAGCTYGYGKQNFSVVANILQNHTGNPATAEEGGEFGCIYTVKSDDIAQLEGTLWEGSYSTVGDWHSEHKGTYNNYRSYKSQKPRLDVVHSANANTALYQDCPDFAYGKTYPDDQRLFVNSGKLTVPIFPQDTKPYTWGSLFSKEGKYRLPLKRVTNLSSYVANNDESTPIASVTVNSSPMYRVVFDGVMWGIGTESKHYNIDVVNTPYECIIADYAGVEENAYLNIITEDNERRNSEVDNLERPATALRATKVETDRIINVLASADPDAVNRLIAQGIGEFHVFGHDGDSAWLDATEVIAYTGWSSGKYAGSLRTGSKVWMPGYSESASTMKPALKGILREDAVTYGRSWNEMSAMHEGNKDGNNEGFGYYTWMDKYVANRVLTEIPPLSNFDAYVYLPGERLTIPEQLTAYFPSSILFKSPRMGFKIPHDKVPARAKKLIIFRTMASHDNNWQPTIYGEVDTIDISRVRRDDHEQNGRLFNVNSAKGSFPIGGAYTEQEDTKTWYSGIYYFDKKRDEELDFGHAIDEYDGGVNPLHSRFVLALNERVYYANFKETYAPHQLRGSIPKLPIDIHKKEAITIDEENTGITDWFYTALPPTVAGKGLPIGIYRYSIVAIDEAGVLSRRSILATAAVNDQIVVLYCLPTGYDDTIKEGRIYRSKDNGAWYLIGTIEHEDEGIFVDDNKPNGNVLVDDEPQTTNYESGVRWSEPYIPDKIKANSFAEYGSGNGSDITGIEQLAGNLVIFKEHNIYRVAVQAAEPPISRTDALTNDLGCIAPNTLININDTIYFLSWKGFYRYNNNIPEPVDTMFKEELQRILDYCKNTGDDRIRDASCGYNPVYDEIYLNIPMLPTAHWYYEKEILYRSYNGNILTKKYGRQVRDTVGSDRPVLPDQDPSELNTPQYEAGHSWDYPYATDEAGHERELLGHIYIVSPYKGYSSKFAYATTWMLYDTDRRDPGRLGVSDIITDVSYYLRKIDHPNQLIRLYYNDTQGNMRSADILPAKYGSDLKETGEETEEIVGNLEETHIEGNIQPPPSTTPETLCDYVDIQEDELNITMRNEYLQDIGNPFFEVTISQVLSDGTLVPMVVFDGDNTVANIPYELSDKDANLDIYASIRIYDLIVNGFVSDNNNKTIRIEIEVWSVIQEKTEIWQYYQVNTTETEKTYCLWKHWHAGIYIETPYDRKYRLWLQAQPNAGMYLDTSADRELTHYFDYDEHLDGRFYNKPYVYRGVINSLSSTLNYLDDYNYRSFVFPIVDRYPIKNKFKSKFFTGDAETAIKRIRKVVVNMFSQGIIDMRGVTVNKYVDDDRMTDNGRLRYGDTREGSVETFQYPPTTDSPATQRLYGMSSNFLVPAGTTTNILSFIPRVDEDALFEWDGYDDVGTKPIRFSIEISSELRTQLNEINLYWRPINLHLS